MEEEEVGTTGSAPQYDAAGDGGDEYNMPQSDLIKLELLRGLIAKNVNLSDFELAELTGFATTKITKMRDAVVVHESDASEKPLSWDYVLCFQVGDKDPKNFVKPSKRDLKDKRDDDDHAEWEEGMEQDKYYGQVFNNFWQRLEAAKLVVRAFRSSPLPPEEGEENQAGDAGASSEESAASVRYGSMFLLVGITEANLKIWADERDTDLLIDPVGGVKVGRTRNFALAKRTQLPRDADTGQTDDHHNQEQTLDISNWDNLYGEYSQQANEIVYKHYKRLPSDESLDTVFDERTRLRIIYESIIADSNEGGAEIKIEDCVNNKNHPLSAVFPLHDENELEYMTTEWINVYHPAKWMWCPLDRIRNYFGEPVAFYFGFLQFYLRWLIAPAIVGIIFFVWQLANDEIAVVGIPFLCFFMIFWSVAFVDFWKRAEARYRLMWGMTKFQQKAVARPQFKGEWGHDAVTGLWTEEFSLLRRACRIGAIYTFVSIWVSGCVVFVVYILLFRDSDPTDFNLKVILGIINGIMIFVFDAIYKLVSRYGNEWENHRTEEDFQNAMIYKSFVFKFVNSFSSLFYLGFIRPSQNGLYYYVRYYDEVCTGSVEYMAQFLELYDPALNDDLSDIEYPSDFDIDCMDGDFSEMKLSDDCAPVFDDDENRNEAWRVAIDGFYSTGDCPVTIGSRGGSLEDDDGNVVDSNGKCYGTCDPGKTTVAQNEVVLEELRIQLLTLFLTAIVIQNTLEVGIPLLCQCIRAKKDAERKTARSRIELESEKDSYVNTIDDMSELIIQYGYVTLFVMAFPLTPLLAIINNVFEMKVDAINLVKTSQRPHPNGSYGLGSWNAILEFFSVVSVATNVALITWNSQIVTQLFFGNPAASWIFFSVLSIALSIIVMIEKWLIPDVPIEVEKAVERQRLVESVLILGAGVDIEADEPPDGEEDGAIQFDPSLEYIDVATLPDVPMDIASVESA